MSELPERVGTIGAGNMAEAILHGLVRAGLAPTNLIASDPATARLEHLHTVLGIETTPDNAEVVRRAEVVVIAVKPQTLEAALAGLPRDPSPLFVSIVAGTPLAVLRTHLGPEARVVRTMPNTPALVGGGITAIAADPITPDQDIARAESVLASVGRVVRVPETQLDAVTGLSGSVRCTGSGDRDGPRRGAATSGVRGLSLRASRTCQLPGRNHARRPRGSRGGRLYRHRRRGGASGHEAVA
jgi:pyrroline-5-carboxylate reductase